MNHIVVALFTLVLLPALYSVYNANLVARQAVADMQGALALSCIFRD